MRTLWTVIVVAMVLSMVVMFQSLRLTRLLQQREEERQRMMEQQSEATARRQAAARCFKAVQKEDDWHFPMTYMSIRQMAKLLVGICYETRAGCEQAWEAKDGQHTTWAAYCWDTTEALSDAGW